MTSVRWMVVMKMQLLPQTSMVLVACEPSETVAVAAEHPGLRDRVAALWSARRLDRALAEGVTPEASAPLALRARRLTEPDRRWSIAGSLRRIVREAERGGRPRPGRVTPNPRLVTAASEELNVLAD